MSSAPGDASSERVVIRQRWRDLLFLHWRIPSAEIQCLLPRGLVVDTFENEAYVGLVPFTMRDVAPAWLAPVPPVSNLLECNVRTYVRRLDGTAPGVWFFSLDASGLPAVCAARALFALPYYFAAMHQTEFRVWDQGAVPHGGWTRRVTYNSERRHLGAMNGRCRIVYETSGGVAEPAAPGTLAEFLLERYTLYASRAERLYAGRVRHHAYVAESAKLLELDESLIAASGLTRPECAPLVHYAREVIVEVSPLYAVII